MIRTVIIDEDLTGKNTLLSILEQNCRESIEVVGCTASPRDAAFLMKNNNPHLVFINVDLPRFSEADLLNHVRNSGLKFIFLTSGVNFTADAFRLNNIKFLRKPVKAETVIELIDQVRAELLEAIKPPDKTFIELEKLITRHSDATAQRIAISMADKIIFVNINDIVYCEASGSYSCMHMMNGESFVSSHLLNEFEKQLHSHKFFRVHHHFLINLNKVKEYQRQDGGYVVMENGKKLEVSKRKRKDFLSVIDKIIL